VSGQSATDCRSRRTLPRAPRPEAAAGPPDAETYTGVVNGGGDLGPGFALLNVQGGSYPDATTRCRVVFED